MCFNKKLSLMSFLFGIISSIILITYGNQYNINVNMVIGCFYIYISLVQLSEFLMWSDIKCESGLNKVASNIMPVMVYLQPVVYHIILNIFIYDKSNNLINNNVLHIINILYALLVFSRYNELESSCTTINEDNHLTWDFTQYDVRISYNIMIILNSINYIHQTNIQIHLVWIYLMFIFSYFYTTKNLAELWCFSSTSTPLIVFLVEKLINK